MDGQVCRICNARMIRTRDHRLTPAQAKPLGLWRCRICAKGARVVCLGEVGEAGVPRDCWVECPDGHLSHVAGASARLRE